MTYVFPVCCKIWNKNWRKKLNTCVECKRKMNRIHWLYVVTLAAAWQNLKKTKLNDVSMDACWGSFDGCPHIHRMKNKWKSTKERWLDGRYSLPGDGSECMVWDLNPVGCPCVWGIVTPILLHLATDYDLQPPCRDHCHRRKVEETDIRRWNNQNMM